MRAWRIAVLTLFAGCAIAVAYGWHVWQRPLPMATERVQVRIAAGATARQIALQLRAAGIDVMPSLFVAAARLTGVTRSLRAGRYEFSRGMNLPAVLDKMRRGDVLRERLTVIEGWTFRQLRAALAAHPELRQDTAALSDTEVLRAIGASESHPEGLFAPDTYLFDPGTSDLQLLRQAYWAQRATLQQAWEGRAAGLPYRSAYEALIMASIVEKETGQADERARIAGVFVNRLRRGMLLQTDPSVIYGLGERFDGNLRKRDLMTDGPYNTYTRAGLPPTPICLPGRASIVAVLNPEPTRALYFVARGDGTSHFSETLAEHNRAVARYQLRGG